MLGDLLMSFFEVARQGSVTAAAKQLRLSQPTVTGRIRQLEEMYGVELFHRRGSRLDLSDLGVSLMPIVERLAQQEGDVDFLLRNAGDLRTGNLRVGATGPYYILPSVAAFRTRHPTIEITIEFGNSQQMLEALSEVRIDLAVSSHAVDDERLHRITLAEDAMVLVVPADDPLARRSHVGLCDIAGCQLLMREPGSITRRVTEEALAAASVEPAGMSIIGSREAIYEAISLGLGCSIVPAREAPRRPDVRVQPFAEHAPVIHEYLYFLKERKDARLVRAFLDCLTPLHTHAPKKKADALIAKVMAMDTAATR
ncbi:LysR substrate-binding domain-containing protein [Ralstonia mannitolilytica]|uniref:LysR substrate-binding domain-containing protein n=1 Tax=Ralstonia mannitolilytica TaxID=105219 RepID=UPI0028F652A9|nr:LysR substrate-binding domain-containing protein [Ralstonia mannitolilytica]CAJ0743165.1 HTH-type transcriptional activator CmpR [Ralstonia mannitolilytica]